MGQDCDLAVVIYYMQQDITITFLLQALQHHLQQK